MNKILILATVLLMAGKLSAQTEVQPKKDELITRPFQLSFITPLGTNGMESGRVINNFSINLMAGYAAGLDGVELAGFANVERYDVKGVQMAGFTNLVGGRTEALQMAGFANVVADSSTGSQLAGFANFSKKHEGLQMAGFANFAGRKIKGMQLAGFMNVAKETEGTQMAGFLNISKKLSGLQLGVINIVDSVAEGTPIGVFSFVKRGYNRFEIGTSEILHLNTSFKFGTRKFYNILSAGAGFHPIAKESLFAVGYGIGHVFPLKKGQLSLDAHGYQLMDTHKPFQSEKGTFNQLSQLKLSYDFPTKSVSYFVGPTFNVLVQQNKQSAEEGWPAYAPYAFYSSTSGHRKVQMWIGAQAGIRF